MYFNQDDYDLLGLGGQDESAYQSLRPQALQPGLLGGVDAQTQAMNLAHGAKAQQLAQNMLAQSQAQAQQAMQGTPHSRRSVRGKCRARRHRRRRRSNSSRQSSRRSGRRFFSLA